MKFVIVCLLVTLAIVQAGPAQKTKCINTCIQNACNADADKKKCFTGLSAEVKCIKDSCDPKYQATCVQGCCKSAACKGLMTCASACPSFQIDSAIAFFESKSYLPVIHNLTKRNHFQQTNSTVTTTNSTNTTTTTKSTTNSTTTTKATTPTNTTTTTSPTNTTVTKKSNSFSGVVAFAGSLLILVAAL